MPTPTTVRSFEGPSFEGLIDTIADLASTAVLRGDRASAAILLSVASLLGEVRDARSSVDKQDSGFSADAAVTK